MVQLSIALVTRNRSESLSRTLHSLSLQNMVPYEIVISDDSSNPEQVEANKSLAKEYGCVYIKGPQKGLYANRNYVAKQCSGTHIRTMDDDHEFPEGHISECMKAIITEPSTIWTIGEYNVCDKNRIKPYPVPGQLHAKGFAAKPAAVDDYFGISCGATIYPREIIQKGILNDDTYKFGIVFLEYGARLKYLGHSLKVLLTTYIIHNDAVTTASQLTTSVINEARVFSMFRLSFIYQPLLKNKILTVMEIVKLLVTKKINIEAVRRAYKNSRSYQNLSHTL